MSGFFKCACLCFALLFLGCDKFPTDTLANTKFTLVNSEDLFQVALPDYMSKATNLSEDASLQYQHLLKELYVIVLYEELNEFQESFQNLGLYNDSVGVLDNYTEVQFEAISEELDITSEVRRKSAKINGLPARIIQFDAEVEGIEVPISYYYTFYQGKENIYLMLSWTLQSRGEKYEPLMAKMAKSFRLMSDLK